jgi:hypothetical protein
MKNPTKKDLDKAISLAMDGYGLKEIMNTTGLSHSQAELAGMAFLYYIAAEGTPVEPTEENAAALRYFYGVSWGRISVMMGLKPDAPLPSTPESRVRNMAQQHTGLSHRGNRIGRGGAFYLKDERLYAESLRETGTVFEVGTDPVAAASRQRLTKLGAVELRKMCDEAGIKYAKSATPARLVSLLSKAGAI